jgi:hypothetical protein
MKKPAEAGHFSSHHSNILSAAIRAMGIIRDLRSGSFASVMALDCYAGATV